jgi:hypothetical protein
MNFYQFSAAVRIEEIATNWPFASLVNQIKAQQHSLQDFFGLMK